MADRAKFRAGSNVAVDARDRASAVWRDPDDGSWRDPAGCANLRIGREGGGGRASIL